MSSICKKLSQYWQENQYLTALTVFSLSVLFISLMGLCLDHRLIMAEHPWIKPVKFSASLATYGITMYWLGRYLLNHATAFRKVCIASLVGTICELSIILIQVLRGAPNHFHSGSNVDNVMSWLAALAIMPVAYSMIAVFMMLIREPHLPRVLGCALRWGVFLSVVGCIPGFMMLAPDTVLLSAHHIIPRLHQANQGIPFLGWSTITGDLRVAHFVGIHALQFFPLVALAVMKLFSKFSITRQELLVGNIGVTYLGVIALLTRQALIAEPLVALSHNTLAYAVLLTLLSINTSIYILFAPSNAVASKLQEVES